VAAVVLCSTINWICALLTDNRLHMYDTFQAQEKQVYACYAEQSCVCMLVPSLKGARPKESNLYGVK
jgi:hypothetical protein